MDILSRTWSLSVIHVLNSEGDSGFNSLKRYLKKVTGKTLSKTLNDLLGSGIIDRRIVPTHPPRVIYSLTRKGSELVQLIGELNAWNDRWQNLVVSSPESVTRMN